MTDIIITMPDRDTIMDGLVRLTHHERLITGFYMALTDRAAGRKKSPRGVLAMLMAVADSSTDNDAPMRQVLTALIPNILAVLIPDSPAALTEATRLYEEMLEQTRCLGS